MRHAFEDLGYRRFEWKCDSLNEPSRRAAVRLGLHLRGPVPTPLVNKGRNRDTDWFSVTDAEWPGCDRRTTRGWIRRTSTTRGNNAGHWVLQRCKDGGIVLA